MVILKITTILVGIFLTLVSIAILKDDSRRSFQDTLKYILAGVIGFYLALSGLSDKENNFLISVQSLVLALFVWEHLISQFNVQEHIKHLVKYFNR